MPAARQWRLGRAEEADLVALRRGERERG